MATVASAYTIERHFRTAEQVATMTRQQRNVENVLDQETRTRRHTSPRSSATERKRRRSVASMKGSHCINRICGYFEKHADRMRYDEYLRRGYPIASGVLEGACRHLVKDRMERRGMRWTLEGARSMLNVRAAFQCDHWRTFLTSRRDKLVDRVHSNRKPLKEHTPLQLAC